MSAPCAVCKTRKPKRSCPVEGEICAPCCGEGREQTIDCPIDCRYLIDSRMHDDPRPIDTSLHPDIEIPETFVRTNRALFTVTCLALFGAALEEPACIDRDLEEALDEAIRTRKSTLFAGALENRLAAGVLERFEKRIAEFREESSKWEDYKPATDGDILKMLVFVRMLASSHDNGRRKSRGFLHFLFGIAAQNIPAEEGGGNE